MTVKVYIVYYAMHGNEERLAKEVEKGANSVEGVEGKLWQVPETLSAEELAKLGEPTKAKSDVPIITPNELSKADGFFFGFPIIFGKMASQFKAFIDETGDLWKAEELAAKPAGILITTCCQGGGKEIVHTAITQLEKHRMIYVSTEIGYIYCTGMVKENEVEEKGEGTYGAGTYNGRVTNRSELADAFQRGVCIAVITKMFKEAAA
ncbi:NAD(P)H dehydrogenase (quinone) FQR1-like [Glycine soja]|uniref:NAD(P)H dehydrogenase (quinone) FQR1-like n=1 Tax=Glycine soja TaxID=3848 RepID=UPI00103C50EE|nr:NAD(P)H dehydrogenase (quinone) FQR1-like [Glycine soja]